MTTLAEGRAHGGAITKAQRQGKRGIKPGDPKEITPEQRLRAQYVKALMALYGAWRHVGEERYRSEVAALDAAFEIRAGFDAYAKKIIARFGA